LVWNLYFLSCWSSLPALPLILIKVTIFSHHTSRFLCRHDTKAIIVLSIVHPGFFSTLFIASWPLILKRLLTFSHHMSRFLCRHASLTLPIASAVWNHQGSCALEKCGSQMVVMKHYWVSGRSFNMFERAKEWARLALENETQAPQPLDN
jgi:hypothetical protein